MSTPLQDLILGYTGILCATYVLWKLSKRLRRSSSPAASPHNIHGPPSPSWFTGHMLQIYDRQGWNFHRDLQVEYSRVAKLQSTFGQPMLWVQDPLALHHVILKDQHVYEEMNWFMNFTHDCFGPGVLATTGDAHRKQRKLLNPIFSGQNLRRFTPVFYEVVDRLKQAIRSTVDSGAQQVDMAKFMGRVSLELIGQATLGQSFDPLTEERDHPYGEALKSLVPALAALSPYIPIYRFMRPLIPSPFRRPLMNLLPSRRVKNMLRVIDTMQLNVEQIYAEKKGQAPLGTTGEDGKASDLVMLLLRANAKAPPEDALREEELVAQLSTLMFGGTDTSSNALLLILQHLIENPDVQEKLRAEITEAKSRHSGGDIPYDELISLPYLDAVLRETLRLNVLIPLRILEARADAVLPLSKPIRGKDGAKIDSIFVPKGMLVFVASQAINSNPDLWGADAGEWHPERWLKPLPEAVSTARIPGIYSNTMTFWGGRRSCIGYKFAQVEIKVVLAELLATFRFEKTSAPVVWNLAEVIHPTVGSDSSRPEYPMKLTLVDNDTDRR